jgi:hypothetical protein
MKCESCGKREAISFSYFGNRNQGQPNGAWMLTCMCTANREIYDISLDDFKKRRSQWLSHLSRKTWMNWGDFWRVLDKFDSAGTHEQENVQRDS